MQNYLSIYYILYLSLIKSTALHGKANSPVFSLIEKQLKNIYLAKSSFLFYNKYKNMVVVLQYQITTE